MYPSLIDTLKKTHYPVVILANYPSEGRESAEGELRKIISDIKHTGKIKILLLDEDCASWSDNILDNVPEDYGILLTNIQFDRSAKLGSFQQTVATVATIYAVQDIPKLRTTKDIGAMLHARCMMMLDATPPSFRKEQYSDNHREYATPSSDVLNEISFLDRNDCLYHSDSLAVYLFKGTECPALLNQIGLSRAITFAAIGAGSGLEIDLSSEDQYYHHLMLWDKKSDCLIGAYRIGFTEEIIREVGLNGLYLNHIFNFQKEFYTSIGNAMELSRSFILPSYQKNPQMLDALWKGLGIIANSRNCYTLYGSVTISASFTPLSQAILVETLDRYHSDSPSLRAHVSSKQAFSPKTQHHTLVADAWANAGINRLNTIIEELEQNQRPIPPLIRYYVSLGAKFSAFQVEESFNNAIYCLLRVDLKKLPRRYQKRFL